MLVGAVRLAPAVQCGVVFAYVIVDVLEEPS